MSDLKHAMPLNSGITDFEAAMPPDMPLVIALCIGQDKRRHEKKNDHFSHEH
jgi:hypothetical protein